MGLFDSHIGRMEGYVGEMRALGRSVRELSGAAGPSGISGPPSASPFRVGRGAGSGLVMKSETFLELGSPAAGSCAFALCTERPELVHDERIRLVGPDVPEVPGGTVPFGQVITAGGEALGESEYPALVECMRVGDQIEGFMVKSATGRIWSRVSADVARRGFNFAFLGSVLIGLVKAQIPKATAVEVLFVTSSKSDLRPMEDIAASVVEIAKGIRGRRWLERGVDISLCAFGGHCGLCADKGMCDEVRKMARTRKMLAQRV